VRVSMSQVVTVGSPQLLEPALSGGVGSPFAIAARRVSINMIAGKREKSRRNLTCDQASIRASKARTEVCCIGVERCCWKCASRKQKMRVLRVYKCRVGTDVRRKVYQSNLVLYAGSTSGLQGWAVGVR
jgi:hypothetical protein